MFGMFGMPPGGGVFEAHYRAMPVAFIDKQQAEFGDKVILPPSALDRLASLHIEYPMLFKVDNPASGRSTHCGVLEFVAEEGVVYMPHWMMQNLLLQVGDMVKFRNVSLPKGKYVKLQPFTSDFLDISNPKAVLERTLRTYTCLTVGDCFVVNYNNRNYEIEVREAKPGNAISVVEVDCQVDFEAPKDYKEPERVPPKPAPAPAGPATDDKAGASGKPGAAAAAATEEPAEPPAPSFQAFGGTARRLDGRPITAPSAPPAAASGSGSGGASSSTAPAPKAADVSASGKAGTFVSTGNRLLDKILKEKGQLPAAPAPAPAPEPGKQEEPKSSFQAFGGKSYSLKG